MKLQDRVGLIFGTVLATLLAVMFLTGASYFATQRERTTIEQRVGPIMEACRQMERLADLMLEEQFIILKDAQARPNAMRQFARYRMEFDLAYQEALLAARNPVVRVLLDEIASLHAKAQANQLRLEALVAQGKVEQASREHRAIGRPLVQIRDDAEKLYTQGIRVVTEMDEEALRRGNLAFRTSFALSLLGAAIAAYLWRQTSRDLVEPLRAIQAAAGELAEGRFIQASHPRADRVAELAALQDDFNRMSARLQDGARRLQATNAELEDQVADRTATLQGLVAELQTLDRLKSDFLANMS
ncbi:MAG: two-component hybrid sensor and regulator, partial [Cyanobacteria bacterium RYN_339]|nr:two-component hybrid sensor and regulator [Cyanobacteria bacterium RYN_339]